MMHRRGNGLLADSYVPLATVSPARADRLLVALREAGIAAYAQAPTGDEGDLLTERDSSPDAFEHAANDTADRVYVDSDAHQRAVDILGQVTLPNDAPTPDVAQTPEPPDDSPAFPEIPENQDRDEPRDTGGGSEWEDLVARFYEAPGNTGSWPDAENVTDRGDAAGDAATNSAGADSATSADDPAAERPRRRHGVGSTAHDRTVSDDTDVAGERQDTSDDEGHDEGHYVPPPPPPIPRGTPVTRLAWTGVLGGPALVLVMVMLLGRTVPSWLLFCVVVGFIAGVVVLVARMPDRPPRHTDPDDGAIT